jgi:FtsH-binding integral membrane protein
MMDSDEAAARLAAVQQTKRSSVRNGAWVASLVASAGALAIGAMLDMDMMYLSAFVVLGIVGLFSMLSIRLRLNWSDRLGAWLVWGGALLALAAFAAVQFPVRAAGWILPNLIGAVAAVVVILLVCRPGLQRLASAPHAAASGKRDE